VGAENGWALAKEARQLFPRLPVIVITGLANHADAELEYWVLPVFLKPLDADQLFAYMRTCHDSSTTQP
jgi:DNA-binding NtrC family response regulator